MIEKIQEINEKIQEKKVEIKDKIVNVQLGCSTCCGYGQFNKYAKEDVKL